MEIRHEGKRKLGVMLSSFIPAYKKSPLAVYGTWNHIRTLGKSAIYTQKVIFFVIASSTTRTKSHQVFETLNFKFCPKDIITGGMWHLRFIIQSLAPAPDMRQKSFCKLLPIFTCCPKNLVFRGCWYRCNLHLRGDLFHTMHLSA